MSLTLKSKGDFELMPEGTHGARCYQIVDLGHQKIEYPFGSGNFKVQEKLILSFETPDVKMKDDRPFIIHQEYTASLNEKANLRKDLEGWRGRKFTPEELKGFYIGDVLSQAALISVVHKTSNSGNTNARINSIAAPISGMVIPEATNPLLKWEIGMPSDGLPDWIKNKTEASLEATGDEMPQDPAPMSENPGEGLTDADAGFNDPIPGFDDKEPPF